MTGPRLQLNQEFVGAARMIAHGDWLRATKRIGCEPAAIRAVAEQESPQGPGFLPDRRPRILFEAFRFGEVTSHRWDATHPNVSSPAWDKSLYRGGAAEYDRLHEAMTLSRQDALESASWGRFQVMGFNHSEVGFPTIDAFIAAMCESEGRQLDAFVAFVMTDHRRATAIRTKDWATFARLYNGSGYRKNHYDVHMARLYQRFAHDSTLLAGHDSSAGRPP